MKKNIFVAGHKGMVGSAILKKLSEKSETDSLIIKDSNELDLTNQSAVNRFFKDHEVDEVYLAAAKVGGIYANNSFPADFIYKNLMIQSNVIHAAFENGVKKLLFLGSSCIYPKFAEQPILEDYLMTGPLESTNEPYAIAKIAGLKLCESYNRQYGKDLGIDYRSVMPTNLYGPGDNYHPENSHVIPALLRRFHEAKVSNANEVVIWGSGKPMREFLFVDDLADASIKIMNLPIDIYSKVTKPRQGHINIGCGTDISILELANLIKDIVEYQGKIVFDMSKPDGTPKKLLDIGKAKMIGWEPLTSLEMGLRITYDSFKKVEAIL